MKHKNPCQSWESNPGPLATHSDALHLVHKTSVSIVVKLFYCLNSVSIVVKLFYCLTYVQIVVKLFYYLNSVSIDVKLFYCLNSVSIVVKLFYCLNSVSIVVKLFYCLNSVSLAVKLFYCLNVMSRNKAKVGFAGQTRSTNSFFCNILTCMNYNIWQVLIFMGVCFTA